MTQYTDEHEFIESLIDDNSKKSEIKHPAYDGLSPIGDYNVCIEQSGDIYITAGNAQSADISYILDRINRTTKPAQSKGDPVARVMGTTLFILLVALGLGSVAKMLQPSPGVNCPSIQQSK